MRDTAKTTTAICIVDGCSKKPVGRNLCSTHWQRWKRYGDPLITKRLRAVGTPEERFWQHVRKTSGCWLWTGGLIKGYGAYQIDGVKQYAHRYSFFLTYGHWPLPQGRHTCDNPPCVRPDHIVEGTHKDNSEDAVARNRQSKGSRRPNAKLTEADIPVIKELAKQGVSHPDIAKMFKVCRSNISLIVNGQRWQHVTDTSPA